MRNNFFRKNQSFSKNFKFNYKNKFTFRNKYNFYNRRFYNPRKYLLFEYPFKAHKHRAIFRFQWSRRKKFYFKINVHQDDRNSNYTTNRRYNSLRYWDLRKVFFELLSLYDPITRRFRKRQLKRAPAIFKFKGRNEGAIRSPFASDFYFFELERRYKMKFQVRILLSIINKCVGAGFNYRKLQQFVVNRRIRVKALKSYKRWVSLVRKIVRFNRKIPKKKITEPFKEYYIELRKHLKYKLGKYFKYRRRLNFRNKKHQLLLNNYKNKTKNLMWFLKKKRWMLKKLHRKKRLKKKFRRRRKFIKGKYNKRKKKFKFKKTLPNKFNTSNLAYDKDPYKFLIILQTKNNFIISCVGEKGNMVKYFNAGMCKFKGPKKALPHTAYTCGQHMGEYLTKMKIPKIILILKSRVRKKVREAFRGLTESSTFKIIKVMREVPLPHNGIRKRKAKRK